MATAASPALSRSPQLVAVSRLELRAVKTANSKLLVKVQLVLIIIVIKELLRICCRKINIRTIRIRIIIISKKDNRIRCINN